MRVLLKDGTRDGTVIDVPHTSMYVTFPAYTTVGWNADGSPGAPVLHPEQTYQVSGEIELDDQNEPLVVWRLRPSTVPIEP